MKIKIKEGFGDKVSTVRIIDLVNNSSYSSYYSGTIEEMQEQIRALSKLLEAIISSMDRATQKKILESFVGYGVEIIEIEND